MIWRIENLDAKRKGIVLLCRVCHRRTRHLSEPDKSEKLVWWACEVCGSWRLFDHWS